MRSFLILVLAFLVAACASHPDETEVPPTDLDLQGARLLADGKPKEALEVFRDSAYNHQSYRGMVGMAHCYASLGDAARFETLAMEAAGRSPRTIESYHRLGVLFVKGAERFRMQPAAQRFAQVGVEYLRRVFAVDPDVDLDLLATLGLGLHLAAMDDSAAIILNDALIIDPGRVDIIHTLLSVYRRQGDRVRTKALLETWHERSEIPAAWSDAWTWANEKSRP